MSYRSRYYRLADIIPEWKTRKNFIDTHGYLFRGYEKMGLIRREVQGDKTGLYINVTLFNYFKFRYLNKSSSQAKQATIMQRFIDEYPLYNF